MARQTFEDVVSWLKTRLETNSDLTLVQFGYLDTKSLPAKSYSAVITPPEEGVYNDEQRYIGSKLQEVWNLEVDIVINRPFREDLSSVTDAKGVSYWKDTIEELLLHQTNGGVFLDTKWNLINIDPSNDRVVLKGLFECEINNNYD